MSQLHVMHAEYTHMNAQHRETQECRTCARAGAVARLVGSMCVIGGHCRVHMYVCAVQGGSGSSSAAAVQLLVIASGVRHCTAALRAA